jgi:hypothetical protein
MLVPESEDERRNYESDYWLAIKYLLTLTLENLAKTEQFRQLAEARHLSVNPSLIVEAGTANSRRKVFDPAEVAKEEIKTKRLRTEAYKVQNPHPKGRGKRVWSGHQNQPSKTNLGPDGTPWRGGARRGGRGGRGARGGGKDKNPPPRTEQA